MEYARMNNGMFIPMLGFGVYMMTPEECESSVLEAMHRGYRLIDTANAYMNERAVGRAMKGSGVPREDIFLTTKLWPSDYGHEKAARAIDATLARLGTGYVDLLLLHQQYGDYLGAWKAMEEAVDKGKVKSIGLSNFNLNRLKDVIDHARILPALTQVECHPYYQQRELKAFLKPYGTLVESWYPLGHGDKALLNEPFFTELAARYSKTNVQIILRWHVQDGNVVIPKSTNPAHIRANMDLFDFALTADEMSAVRKLDQNKRYFTTSEAEQEKRFLSWSPDFDAQK